MNKAYLVILVILILHSSCNNNRSEDLNLSHLDHLANCINNDLGLVKKEILDLANSLQYKIPFNNQVKELSTDKYIYRKGQILYSTYSRSNSAVYCPANLEITDELKKTIVNSEQLDTFFIKSVLNNPFLSQVYYIDTNSFLRIYPYIDVLSYLNSSVDLRTLAPYQKVKDKPFLNDNAYWINQPFADPYGRGWIISCTEPVYYRDQFIGIISGDVSLRSIKDKYLSSDTEQIILTDDTGKTICCTKEASKILNIPVIREFRYYKPITEDVFNIDNPSLKNHKNKSFRNAFKALMLGKDKAVFIMNNKKFTIYKSQIRETNWLLFKIIN